jgi:hypothetical protein
MRDSVTERAGQSAGTAEDVPEVAEQDLCCPQSWSGTETVE